MRRKDREITISCEDQGNYFGVQLLQAGICGWRKRLYRAFKFWIL